jgi:hypothetical protein
MTVIILTTGASWSVPADWTNVNQVETWGAGGGAGGGNTTAGGGGGSGGYSTSSGITGLSGSITISIGTAGTGSQNNGTAGGPTWFNGATQSASTVSANGGGLGTTTGTGGAGASTTGATGTTKTAGSAGGAQNSGAAGGGAGAPGPNGIGAIGSNATSTAGGAGGTGNNGSGGAGGAGGTTAPGNGGAGTANASGAGGGGGGGNVNVSGDDNGGVGGLPGAGGGGGGGTALANGTGGNGGGGQIRITYTPASASVGTQWDDSLVPNYGSNRYRTLKAAKDTDAWDYAGWQHSPLSTDSVLAKGSQPTVVPDGKFNWSRYQDWQRAPLPASYTIQTPILPWTALPQTTWTSLKYDYSGWLRSPIPAEFLVPLPVTSVPDRVYNSSRYQGWAEEPTPSSIVQPSIFPWYDLPVRTWDARHQELYAGTQLAPPPTFAQTPIAVFDVPVGKWNSAKYQDWQQWYQRAEYVVPPAQVDVPRNVSRHDYSGWALAPHPQDIQFSIPFPLWTDLPPRGALQSSSRYTDLFNGFTQAPPPASVIPTVPAMWLPLLGVGNQGP